MYTRCTSLDWSDEYELKTGIDLLSINKTFQKQIIKKVQVPEFIRKYKQSIVDFILFVFDNYH